MLKVINSLYTEPKFRAKFNEEVSDYKQQHSGIRQGCPLSPYLFILLMTCMFHDIHHDTDRQVLLGRVDHINFTEILYADDTLLMSKNSRPMNKLIAAIEKESAYYGMRLNKKKCQFIAMNGNNNIHFADGKRLDSVEQAMYLGGTLTRTADAKTEVEHRIAETMGVMKALQTFWKKTNCPFTWKLNVYNAVIVSKLTYGLETLQPVDGLFNRLNAFHIRAIRRILNIPPTFINRDMTNNYVLQQAEIELNKDNVGPKRKVKMISDIIKQRQASFLGHVIRSEERDPMKMVSFGNEELNSLEDIQLRVGRPRKKWVHETMSRAWADIRVKTNRDNEEYQATSMQRDLIKTWATNRIAPFQTKTCKLSEEQQRMRRRLLTLDTPIHAMARQ